MDEAIKRCIGQGDFIRIRTASQDCSLGSQVFGEVVATVNEDRLRCRVYSLMTSSILTKFLLPPITESLFPVAARTVITEVVATNTFKNISRDEVEDLVFILPISELESGDVFITGATNLYFVRYLVDQTFFVNFYSIQFFGYHFIQPLTIRIFSAINMLAFTIKN
jgi:hypothetical protein